MAVTFRRFTIKYARIAKPHRVARLLLARRSMHTRNLSSVACGVLTAVFLNAQTGYAQELLPNLVARPASEFSLIQINGRLMLRFAATSWNNGAGPLELRSGSASESQGQNVYQRIFRSDGTYIDELAGTFIWHPTHDHFHFGDFALYTFNAVGGDPGSEQASAKTSFCVMDTTAVDLSLTGAPHSAVYSACNKFVQGMSVGWGDRYGPTLAGQSFDITGLPAGDYDLTVISDPNNRLLEANESDNRACVRLRLNPSAWTVQSLGTCGSVSVTSISPNTIKKGTTIQVTVTGSGFAAGMAVGFENGSGPAPVVTNVSITANTITATVSVKNGGNRTTRYWDLRVGPALLPGAMAVIP